MRESERERRLREGLKAESSPSATQAEERAWRVVQATYDPNPAQQRSPRWRRRLVQAAVVAGLVVVVVSPAGAKVRDWVKDAVDPGREDARPALTSLPAPGRLLVESKSGAWVVRPDGSKRLLGQYRDATWSPRGLFVAATTAHQLLALDADGGVRWTLARNGPVRSPSWNSPDGFRIAYLDGDALRVVAGDGTGDRLLARGAANVAPAWMPGSKYLISYAKQNGAVNTIAAESGRPVFTTHPGPDPVWLEWSNDGTTLLVARPSGIELYDDTGNLIWHEATANKEDIVGASLAPNGASIATILRTRPGARSRLILGGPHQRTRSMFSGPGNFTDVTWSPNGKWVLLGWRSADQWLFLNPDRPKQIAAISNISSQFDPGNRSPRGAAFPSVKGWCCDR